MGGRGALRFARADNAPPPSFARLCSTLCRMLSARLSAWRPCVRMASFWTSSASRRTRKSAARPRIFAHHRPRSYRSRRRHVTRPTRRCHGRKSNSSRGTRRRPWSCTHATTRHSQQPRSYETKKEGKLQLQLHCKSICVPVLCGKGVSRLPVDVLVNCAAAGAFACGLAE